MNSHVKSIIVNISFLDSLFDLFDYLKTVKVAATSLDYRKT